MALTNTAARYGSITKTFHWLTALLIFTAFPLGILAHDAPSLDHFLIYLLIYLLKLF